MPLRILSISYDASLLNSRRIMLEQRGYTVTCAEGFVQALKRCHEGGYDLVVIGHSIPPEDKRALLEVVKRECPVPVVALLRADEPPLDGATASVDAMNPQNVLDTVDNVLKERKAATAG